MSKRPYLIAAGLLAAIGVAASAWWQLGRGGADAGRASPGGAIVYNEPESAQPFRYDIEYPFISYRSAPRSDAVAALSARIAAGEARLALDEPRGVLDSLLAELDIDPASQVLVFSTTSLQVGSIRARTPRAIYFNDDVYVAWVQGGGPVEIASMDPQLGPIFYTLEHDARAAFEVQNERCLRCHDSVSLSGNGVPRFIVGSGYIGPLGDIVTHEGWIITSQRTPFRNRFGGWYVTGQHGDQVHLGNVIVRNIYALENLEALRVGNVDSLDGLVDTSDYAAPGSDIVAQLVLQHQIDVQNEISRVSYRVRAEQHRAGAGADIDADVVADLIEPLVETMLFVGETPLEGPIEGSSSFSERFERRGPADPAGRSLRELQLEGRLMRYPLSYQIYSRAFDALPEAAKTRVYARLAEILRGEDASDTYAHLDRGEKAAILEILTATKPDFADAAGEP